MNTIQVYDPAMCCSSGVCGTEVDQALVDFSANVQWASQQGATIERFNLANQPMAFVENPVVKDMLWRAGQNCLPMTLLDGALMLAGRYPTRDDLAKWAGIELQAEAAGATSGCCCAGGKCC